MHIFLPNFARHHPQQIGTPFKNARKFVHSHRPKTMQVKRAQTIYLTNTVNNEKQQKINDQRKNLSFYLPQSSGTVIAYKSIPNKSHTISLLNVNQQQKPIHSRKTSKLVQSLYLRRKRQNQQKNKSRNKSAVTISLMIAHSPFTKTKPLINDQIYDDFTPSTFLLRNIKKKFPRKKVKSAFVSEQFRPWSPNRGQYNQDQVNN